MSTPISRHDAVVPPLHFVRDVSGYVLSKNYNLLVELVRRASVICLCRSGNHRDVAQTIYRRTERGEEFMIGAHGVTYVVNWSAKEFIADCVAADVEFIPPNIEITPPANGS